MGTRSLTFVYDNGTPVVCMYRQFDGYPTAHGQELAAFLRGKTLVNGFTLEHQKRKAYANGMGCLAAQMIADFKTGIGGFYLLAVDTVDANQDYEYHVYENKVVVKSFESEIFSGTWSEFEDFCYEEETVKYSA